MRLLQRGFATVTALVPVVEDTAVDPTTLVDPPTGTEPRTSRNATQGSDCFQSVVTGRPPDGW